MELMKTKTKKSYYGPIPEDWIECRFEDVFTGFSSGMTPYRGNPEFYEGSIPWITSGELNYNIITDTYEKITLEAVSKTNLKMLPIGTFLMAITGLEAAGTRGSCAITGVMATTNQSCMALYPIPGKSLTEYLYHFYVKFGDELAFTFCQGSKQQSYTGKIARILPIVLPRTISEQKAIASALNDIDDLINGLKILIDKKKAIKQGAMQQLLTPPDKGGKRLAGFSKKWVNVMLSDLCSVIGGGTPSTFVPEFWGRNINWFTPGEIGHKKHLKKSKRKISEAGLQSSSATLLPKGSILLTSRASIGEVGILEIESCTNQGFQSLSPHFQTDSEFLYYLIQTKRKDLLNLSSGSTFLEISPKNVKSMIVSIPTDIIERQAIGDVLSNIDSEIEILEQKKAKYQHIKQGMMQELLTGKTRLV